MGNIYPGNRDFRDSKMQIKKIKKIIKIHQNTHYILKQNLKNTQFFFFEGFAIFAWTRVYLYSL